MDPQGRGLRSLSRAQIDSILEPAQCAIVSLLSNQDFDSYVLSESSLFIYPRKIILKTCGTTKLLSSIPTVLHLAAKLSLPLLPARYSRGTFIFPGAQPAPQRDFSEEVSVLNRFFGGLKSGGTAYVTGDPSSPGRNWHTYYATEKPELPLVMPALGVKRCALTGTNVWILWSRTSLVVDCSCIKASQPLPRRGQHLQGQYFIAGIKTEEKRRVQLWEILSMQYDPSQRVWIVV